MGQEQNKPDGSVIDSWIKSVKDFFSPRPAPAVRPPANAAPEVSSIVPVIPAIDGQFSFQDSGNIASGRRAYFGASGRESLLLDDPRLNTAYEQMMNEYHLMNDGHKLSPRERERALVESGVNAIEATYGRYNQGVSDALELQRDTLDKYAKGKISDKEADRALAASGRRDSAAEDHHFKLSEVPKGILVCRQRAAVLSYLMEKAGVPNYMATGVLSDDRSETLSTHAWVMSKQTGDIWESTASNGSMGYRKNIQNLPVSDILAGAPVITGGDYGYGNVYGTGFRNIPALRDALKGREHGKSEVCSTGTSETSPVDAYQRALLVAAEHKTHDGKLWGDHAVNINPLDITVSSRGFDCSPMPVTNALPLPDRTKNR